MHIYEAPGGIARGRSHRRRALPGVPRPSLRRHHGGGAEILALRGATADPAAPFTPSPTSPTPTRRIGAPWPMGMLREAKVYAEGAYDTVGWSLDRLLAAHSLLEHPGLPGVDALLDAERGAAHGYLVVAENLAGVSSAYAYTALCFMFSELDLEF
ncbi:unnamed protein product [Urochloa decumbens]|uniref:Uncharacterized protein n=1 Tax=Urochloa decumbens TaxID=240449 RepID=A0ABC8YXN9_9POAL